LKMELHGNSCRPKQNRPKRNRPKLKCPKGCQPKRNLRKPSRIQKPVDHGHDPIEQGAQNQYPIEQTQQANHPLNGNRTWGVWGGGPAYGVGGQAAHRTVGRTGGVTADRTGHYTAGHHTADHRTAGNRTGNYNDLRSVGHRTGHVGDRTSGRSGNRGY
jgi:hypothetical protein